MNLLTWRLCLFIKKGVAMKHVLEFIQSMWRMRLVLGCMGSHDADAHFSSPGLYSFAWHRPFRCWPGYGPMIIQPEWMQALSGTP
jgi:hypothetical protein